MTALPTLTQTLIASTIYLSFIMNIYFIVTRVFPSTKRFMLKTSAVLVLLYAIAVEVMYIAS